MEKWPKLIFPPIELKARRAGCEVEVLHTLRGIWLKLTPEEWVRRHVVGWLVGLGIEPQRIVEEYPVPLNGQPQRADVVVVDSQGNPRLIVECKAPGVKISQQTLDQVVRYNSVLEAEYLLLTNGRCRCMFRYVGGAYMPLEELPHDLITPKTYANPKNKETTDR